MIVEDPLNWLELEVYDIASARYALKLANDNFYAVYYMRVEMEKELARSAAEVYSQSLRLVQKYIPPTVDSQGMSHPIQYVPNPIPEIVPLHVRNGIAYMNEQLLVERERAEAELTDEIEPLQEIVSHLEEIVRDWFLKQIAINPGWLDGFQSIVIGGCTLAYANGAVTFSYAEIDYE